MICKPDFGREYVVDTSRAIFKATAKVIKNVSPSNRLLFSTSKASRKAANNLVEHSLMLNDAHKGIPNAIPVESAVKIGQGKSTILTVSHMNSFKKYKRLNPESNVDNFNNEIIRAIEGVDGRISKEAKEYSTLWKKYIESNAKRMEKVSDSIDFKLPGKYFLRGWDMEKVRLNPRPFEIALEKEFKLRNVPNAAEEALSIAAELKKGTSTASIRLMKHLSKHAKDSKNKGLFLNDTLNNFRNNDVIKTAARYSHDIESYLAFKEKFGTTNPYNKMKAEIDAEYTDLISKEKSAAAKKKLNKEWTRDLKDVKGEIEILQGNFRLPDDPHSTLHIAGRMARKLSYVARGGLMGLTQLGDAGRLLFADTVNLMIGKELTKAAKGFKATIVKMSKKDLMELDVAMDTVMSQRTGALANVNDIAEATTKMDDWAKKGVDFFSTYVNWIAPINDTLRKTAANMGGSKMMTSLDAWTRGILAKGDVEDLLRFGISKEDAVDALIQLNKHKTTKNGVTVLNLHLWDGAQNVVSALRRSVDELVILPGAGDLPFWMKGPVGQIVGQFKAFSMTSMNRVLLPALQRGDGKVAVRMAAQSFLGSMIYLLKGQINGVKDIDTSPQKLILEGIDRGGVLGYMFDVNNVFEKLTNYGVYKSTGSSKSSRFYNKGVLAALLGPTGGLTEDLASGMQGILSGEPTASELRKLGSILPLSNAIGIGRLKKKLAEEYGE